MILHAVTFVWKEGVGADQVERVRSALDRMAAEVPSIQSLRHGPDLGLRQGNGQYGLVATFADEAGWRAYQDHAAHKRFVADIVAPLQSSRLAVQIAV